MTLLTVRRKRNPFANGDSVFSELMDFNTGSLEKFETFAAPVELVLVDLGNAALLNEERAVDAGTVRNEDCRAL